MGGIHCELILKAVSDMKKVPLKIMKAFLNALLNRAIRQVRNLDIFKRLILIFLIIIFVPNILTGYFAFIKFSAEIESILSKNSYKSLYDLDRSISERLKSYSDLSYRIYLNNELKNLLRKCKALAEISPLDASQTLEYDDCKKRIGNILYEMSLTLQGIVNIEIISGNDEFTEIGSNGEQAGARLADAAAFRKSPDYKRSLASLNLPVWCDTTRENSTYVVQSNPSLHLGNYITVMRSIPEPRTEENLGIILINIPLGTLSDVLEYEDFILQEGNLLLIGDSGIIYFFRMANRFPVLTLPDKNTLEAILKLNKSNAIVKISGREYLVSAIKSDFTGWTLCSMFPRRELLQNVYDLRNLVALISVVCIIFAFIMSYIVTVSISRPIRSLKNAMGKVDEKNIEIEYKDDIGDEVGVLGQKFNSMIKRIQNLIRTVYEAELIKKEEIIKRREAELNALQMQINPHFLYNTLDIIRWQVMAAENGEGKASRMISKFSKLLQMGTERSANLVRLQEEIDHAYAYIEVVNFDIEYKLRVTLLAESNNLLESKIPKFTLQPLIENAVVHGFAHTQMEGEIILRVFLKNDDLMIEVRDNGEGIPEDTVAALNCGLSMNDRDSKGIGLKNVNERIKLSFGKQYGIMVNSKRNEYTAVMIHLPNIK